MNNFWSLITSLGVIIFVIFLFSFWRKNSAADRPGFQHKILKTGHQRFTISIPPGYPQEGLVPLVIVLHYAGHGSPYFGELILIGLAEPALRELGAIMVAPDCPARDWVQPQSDQVIMDLLDFLLENYQIDPQRIVITGYSMGAKGVWHLAGRHPERFSAAIAMAGPPPADALEIDWQIPLMVIHGRKDEKVPFFETQDTVLKLEEKGVDITFRVLAGVTHYETHHFVGALQNAIPWLQEKWKKQTE